jgi:hypothetical protein
MSAYFLPVLSAGVLERGDKLGVDSKRRFFFVL